MALIQCSECKKEISDQATSCPNCGAPIKAKKQYWTGKKKLLETVPKKLITN